MSAWERSTRSMADGPAAAPGRVKVWTTLSPCLTMPKPYRSSPPEVGWSAGDPTSHPDAMSTQREQRATILVGRAIRWKDKGALRGPPDSPRPCQGGRQLLQGVEADLH